MFNSANILRFTVLLISMFSLAACGGGGGGGGGGAATTYTVGGDISGHTGDVSLTLNGGTSITVSPQDTSFTFANQALSSGDVYAVDVTAPTGQSCILTGSGGQIQTSNITNIKVECKNLVAGTFSIGGRVTGLTTGLSVFVSLNQGTPVEVNGNNQFIFSNQLLGLGDGYSVIITTQPVTLECKGTNVTGNVADNVTNIKINCSVPTYTVGGKVTGHRGDVVLSLNGDAVNTVIVTGQDSVFTFSGIDQALNIGATYTVTATEPNGQTCKVDLGVNQGTIARTDVLDVSVVCDDINYSIGGNITNLNSVSSIGLTLNNGPEYILSTDTLITNSVFTMPTTVNIDNKYAYSIKVKTHPAGQTCAVTGGANKNGTGFASADVADIAIKCTNIAYNVSGAVSGLNAGSSISLTLSIADMTTGKFVSGQPILVKANNPAATPGAFTFSKQVININQQYKVDAVNPAGQTCLVDLGVSKGKAPAGNIGDISVVCTNTLYTVGGKAGNFAATSGTDVLKLSLNGGTPITVVPGSNFAFPAKLTIGTDYVITVAQSPSGIAPKNIILNCSLTDGTGTMGSAPVANVGVSCDAVVYKIGGKITGLNGVIKLLNNNSDLLSVTGVAATPVTNFEFLTPIGALRTYIVSIDTQPPGQFCKLTPGTETGTTTGLVNTVLITCENVYDISVEVTDLRGSITFLNNGVETIVTADSVANPVTGLIDTGLINGTAYLVTKKANPPGQLCTLSANAAGPKITGANVKIIVGCANLPYTIGGSISGNNGLNVGLKLNNGAEVLFNTPTFAFSAQPLAIGDSYTVTLGATQPTGFTCFIDPATATGTIATSNIINVAINCIGNAVDLDNDGLADVLEVVNGGCKLSTDPKCAERGNPDTDLDTYLDGNDVFPNDFDEWLDFDGDGIGDNADLDDDNDKVNDVNDFFPFDVSSWAKTVLDLSSLGNNNNKIGDNGFKINGINAKDFSGVSISSTDVNGDSIPDLIIGASGANGDNSLGIDKKSDPGETYVVFGQSNFTWPANFELSSLDGTNGFIIKGNRANDRSGISVSGLGDINGDGKPDFIIGAAEADTNSGTVKYANKEAGKAYVVFGRGDWADTPVLNLSDKTFPVDPANPTVISGFVINGINAGDLTGNSVKNAGDINNDGVSDIIIGARGKLTASTPGYTYVLFGRLSAWPNNEFNLSTLAGDTTAANGFVVNGINSDDFSGWSVSGAGDVNGDSIDDIVIGARDATAAGISNAGETYVIFGRANTATWSPVFNLSTLTAAGADGSTGFIIQGISAGDQSGSSVSSAGDINNDTVADIIIGAQKSDPNGVPTAGESYIVFGKLLGANVNWPTPVIKLSTFATGGGAEGFVIEGIASNDQNGIAVSSLGDVNGDQIDDFITSASLANVATFTDAGESYIIFGKTIWGSILKLSTLSAGSADGSIGFVARGISMSDNSGIAVSSIGDFNNDGLTDFSIGASKADANGQSSSGETYVIFGCDYFSATTLCVTNLP